MSKNNENSVLFSIGSVIELAQQKESERQAAILQQKEDLERATAERLAQTRRAVEETERARLTQIAEAARQDWESQVADKEAAIRARIDANTERELEMLRAEYRDSTPMVVPGRSRMSFAVASLVALAIFGLGAFGVHAMGNDNQNAAHTATANAGSLSATEPMAERAVRAPERMTTPRPVASAPVKIDKPVIKPRTFHKRPRCRWITTTKRVLNPLRNHPLNFEGRYIITKKRVKKCRK